MTKKITQKPNTDIKNTSSISIKSVLPRDHRLFKYMLMQHETKRSSKSLLKSKMLNNITTEKLYKNAAIETSYYSKNKPIKDTNNHADQTDNLNPITSHMTPPASMKPGLIEENLGILAQVRASCSEEELNFLFRKMVLNFSSTRDESSFFIKNGIFSGAYFKIKKDGRKLNLNIRNAQKKAAYLLTANKMILKERLAHHQIELGTFNFC